MTAELVALEGVTFGFTREPVLREVSMTVGAGAFTGVVGPSGSGKTTLLRILLGQEAADAGSVQIAPGVRLGYLAQGLAAPPEATLQQALDAALGDPAQAEADFVRLAAGLAAAPHDAALLDAYDAALARLEAVSRQADPGRAAAVLAALGLEALPRAVPLAELSGGQKTRLGLALVVLGGAQLLLLDEPTNHLDLDALLWLEGWLARFNGAALIVSHDRALLDHSVSTILELDTETQGVRAYPGNYSAYVEARIAARERQWQAWRDQEAEVRRVRQDIAHTKEQAKRVELSTTPRTPGPRRYAKKVARKALAREKKLERFLDSDERVDKPRLGWQMKLAFDGAPASGRDVLVLDALEVGYAAGAPLLRGVDQVLRYGERVALIGANGAGKTTLARTIAGRLAPLAGRVRLGAGVRLGYFAQEQELLRPELDALETLREASGQSDTDLRHFLHFFLFEGDDVFVPAAELSHGERARLALALLVAQGCNFLLLDEPINHLDIPSRARFEQALTAFEGTVLAVVHDRYFIERFASGVWKVADGELRAYGDLEEALGRAA
jgi:ATP-binding cassette subfamily F protein 3